jgi:hypothetical protein
MVPGLQSKIAHTLYDWNYTTVNIPGYNNRSIDYQRGHILGGSSAVSTYFKPYSTCLSDLEAINNLPYLMWVQMGWCSQEAPQRIMIVGLESQAILDGAGIISNRILSG